MKAFADALIRSVAANLMALVTWIIWNLHLGAPNIISQGLSYGGMIAAAMLFGMIVTKGYAPRQLHLVPIIIGWLLPLSPLCYTMRDVKDPDIMSGVLLSLFVAAGVTSTYILRFPKAHIPDIGS